ncbi:MAG: chemotaxis protein CheA [Deltaproteobacteria bacterium]|nr:MAG: chemotaxis protein CheA [Deltaproteobacteria bacterium]
MAEDRIAQIADEIALQVLTVDPGDLPALGKVLEKAEELAKASEGRKELEGLAFAIKRALEKVVLEEFEPGRGFRFLTEGIKALQALLRGQGPREDLLAEAQALGLLPGDREEAPQPQGEGEVLPIGEDLELYQSFIAEAREHLASVEVKVVELESRPDDQEVINAIFRPFHTIKGVAGFLNLTAINRLAHALEDMLEAARGGRLTVTPATIDLILEGVDALKAMIDDLEEVIRGQRKALRAFPVEELIAKVRSEMEGGGGKLLGEVLVERGAVKEEDVREALELQKRQPHKKVGEILVEKGKVKAKDVVQALREQRVAEATVKIEARKLDSLMDMVGELVIAQSMIRQNPALLSLPDSKLHQDIGQLARITSELQKTAMALRMVPIRQTFQKMIRLVRDLAKKSGKRVQLQMEGEETEIDRNMVEEIYEPLVHMVRNAIDHGIEPPEDRRARGKPEEGTVLLRAYHKGGNIVIEISDDGRGLDREKILKRAREQGLVAEGEELSDKEVLHLIFRPGFSTAEEVTDVSGRGVGMDVVKKAVEKLRGRIEVESTPGEGSTFTLRLPLTLAIIDGMVLRVGDERCILPTLSIQEALKPSKEQCFTVTGKGEMIKVRDELLPLVRLHALFGLPDGRPPWEALVIVAESEGRKKCLLADEVLGKQEVVIKSLGEAFGAVKGVAGGAIMGDGRVGLILDVAGIFKLSEEGELA